MKKFIAATVLSGLFFVVSSAAQAYTWSGNSESHASGSGDYRGRGHLSDYSNTSNKSSNHHTYLNYASSFGNTGGYVSLPTGGSIYRYNDPGNDRTVVIPVRASIRPPQGNYGRAINRGYKQGY